MIFNFLFGGSSKEEPLPTLSNPGVAADLRNGKQLIDGNRKVVTGVMPDATLATPTIAVNKSGQITATVAQEATGYMNTSTKNATKKLSSADDPNFIASNIKSGVSIFGLAGTLKTSDDMNLDVYNNTDDYIDAYYVDVNGELRSELDIRDGDYVENLRCLEGSIVVVDVHTRSSWIGGAGGDSEKILKDDNTYAVYLRSGGGVAITIELR